MLSAYRFGVFAVDLNKGLHLDYNLASISLHNTSPPMNPAEVSNLQTAFAYQSDILKGYQEHLGKLQAANEYLTHYLQSLSPTMNLIRR